MQRMVTKPEGFTLSSGVTVPQGTMLAVPERAIHNDFGMSCIQPISVVSDNDTRRT